MHNNSTSFIGNVLSVQNVEVRKFLFNEARITYRTVRIKGECKLGALIEVGISRARSKWEIHGRWRSQYSANQPGYAKTLFLSSKYSMILCHRPLHHYTTTPLHPISKPQSLASPHLSCTGLPASNHSTSSTCKCAPTSSNSSTTSQFPTFRARNNALFPARLRTCTLAPLANNSRRISILGHTAATCTAEFPP